MTNDVAASPAKTGDETRSESLTADQAAARLFASAAKAPAQKPVAPPAAAETSPEQSAPSNENAAAEAQPASAEAETPTPAPEDETTAAETTDEPADDVLSPAPLDEELKAKVQKRIDKEIHRRKLAETQMVSLQNRLKELESRTTNPAQQTGATQTSNTGKNLPLAVPNQPLANINDMAALTQLKQSAKAAVRWAEDTLDNPKAWKVQTEVDPQTGEEKSKRVLTVGKDIFDEDQVRAYKRDNKITLEDHVPAREDFLQVRARASKDAREAYSFLNDATAPEYQQAQSMLRDPWVQMRPDAEWIVATQIMGIKGLEAARAAAKNKADPTKPKPVTAKPGSDQSAVSQSGAPSRMAPEAARRLASSKEREALQGKGGITAAEAAAFLERSATTRKPG